MATEFVGHIQDPKYTEKRLEPAFGDPDYLHLADLLAALEMYRSTEDISVLDYGCGGSPYRSLFPNASYKRADYGEMNDLDYVMDEQSRISAGDQSFDLILSTQVAEHVMNPSSYFSECFRLLKPGGRLLCTTHGTYPDHGCPFDFQRWTADGLRRDLSAIGFSVEKVYKVTTNARALMYLIQRFSGWFDTPARASAAVFRIMRSAMHRSPGYWQRFSDKAFAHNRVVDAEIEGHDFYLVLFAAAIRR